MLNYEEELKKFKPCLEAEGTDISVREEDLTDVLDLIRGLAKEPAPGNTQKDTTEQ